MIIPIISAHDRYFRSSMQNPQISQPFFQTYLPQRLSAALDFTKMTLEDTHYLDKYLQETISDMVFDCPYTNDVQQSHNPALDAKLVLLVEHQSTPHKLMAFRVWHYLFNMLHTILKKRDKAQQSDKLPAVYALLFYHGEQTPYPYSLDLADSFDDPLGVMQNMLTKPINLIDIGQVPDDEIPKLVGNAFFSGS